MSTPVSTLGISRTTRAMGKLPLIVSSVLLIAIMTVTFSVLDPSLF